MKVFESGVVDAHLEVGDGVQPIEARVLMNRKADEGPKIDLASTVAPLPSTIDIDFDPGKKASKTEPLKLTYSSSATVDIDADATSPLARGRRTHAARGDAGRALDDLRELSRFATSRTRYTARRVDRPGR